MLYIGKANMKHKIVIEIEGGVLQSIYGDKLPVDVEFILRDMDNIEAGDDDPISSDEEQNMVSYW